MSDQAHTASRGAEHSLADGSVETAAQSPAGWVRVGAIERPEMTNRGLHGQIMDAGWPEFGGNHQSAEFWEDFSRGAHFTLTCLCDWGLLTFPAKHGASERLSEARETVRPGMPSSSDPS
jgi:hypothetical protein